MADSIDRGVGGYDNEFASPLPLEYECPICHLAFREPVQLEECGHRFCQSCLMELRKRLVWHINLNWLHTQIEQSVSDNWLI